MDLSTGSVPDSHVTVIVGAQCTAERCAAVGVGERHRETLCIAFNGTLLDAGQCDPDTRPDNVEGCQHDACVTTWSTSSWSKVPYTTLPMNTNVVHTCRLSIVHWSCVCADDYFVLFANDTDHINYLIFVTKFVKEVLELVTLYTRQLRSLLLPVPVTSTRLLYLSRSRPRTNQARSRPWLCNVRIKARLHSGTPSSVAICIWKICKIKLQQVFQIKCYILMRILKIKFTYISTFMKMQHRLIVCI